MWSIPCAGRNLENGSEENGGLLLEKNHWEFHIVRKGLVSIR